MGNQKETTHQSTPLSDTMCLRGLLLIGFVCRHVKPPRTWAGEKPESPDLGPQCLLVMTNPLVDPRRKAMHGCLSPSKRRQPASFGCPAMDPPLCLYLRTWFRFARLHADGGAPRWTLKTGDANSQNRRFAFGKSVRRLVDVVNELVHVHLVVSIVALGHHKGLGEKTS